MVINSIKLCLLINMFLTYAEVGFDRLLEVSETIYTVHAETGLLC